MSGASGSFTASAPSAANTSRMAGAIGEIDWPVMRQTMAPVARSRKQSLSASGPARWVFALDLRRGLRDGNGQEGDGCEAEGERGEEAFHRRSPYRFFREPGSVRTNALISSRTRR